ncbi:hypothetical protein [Amycolatopsis azurea]|uniref:hypothetical protein n=1 Tax=Amycolatopsis azurea TaxID=36819 RepID=UPI001177CBC3|nr:hypothetical protein [Amycolatopsis azurea]
MTQWWKRAALAGAGVLVLLVTGVVTWGILQDKKADWFSAWASGASAIIAVFALGAAAVAATATIATNRNQSEQLRRLEEASQREHASKFGVWPESDRVANMPPDVWLYSIRYHNAGSLPVYNVKITARFMDKTLLLVVLPLLAPTSEPEVVPLATDALLEFVNGVSAKDLNEKEPPSPVHRNQKIYENNRRKEVRAHRGVLLNSHYISVSCEFSDGESQWHRDYDGSLHKVSN